MLLSLASRETRQMGQVLEKYGPMFRKPRRPRLRPGQPWNTPNPSLRAARPQQTGQTQSLAAPIPATRHPATTVFGLGPGNWELAPVVDFDQPANERPQPAPEGVLLCAPATCVRFM